MNVRVEELSPIKKKLYIEVDADTVNAELDKAYQQIAKTASVKGFRKGKVPKAILERNYGPKAEYDAVNALIQGSLFMAVMENKVDAVAQPEVVESGTIEQGQPFSYEAEVDVRPEIVAKDYKGLVLEKDKFVFNDSTVDAQLKQMAESKVSLEVTSRKKARENDTVIIDFTGYVDGEAFENGAATDYQLELGSNSFIPGFEEQVIGMKRDQEKEIAVSFPEAYGAESLAGKDATFTVLVKEIKEKVVPKIDNNFAKEMDAEDLDELKQRIQDDISKQEEQRIESQLHERMMESLVEKNAFDVPESMISSQLGYLKDNFTQRLQQQGMTLEMLGMNEDGFKKAYQPLAEQQVKGELILDSVARQEEVDADDSEVEAKMKEFAEQGGMPLDQVEKYFETEQAKNGLKGQIVQEKVVKFILDSADITEVEPKKAEAPAEEGTDEEAVTEESPE